MRWTTTPLPRTARRASQAERNERDGRESSRLHAPATAKAAPDPHTDRTAPGGSIAAGAIPDRELAPAPEDCRCEGARPGPGVLRLRHADRA